MSERQILAAVLAPMLWGSVAATAQTTVLLPDTSQTTSVSVTIPEQARVVVPASLSFNVSDIRAASAGSPATITMDQVVLASATKQLRLALQATAANFTPPTTGATTWAAGDVSWNAAPWTSATGQAGTLSNSAFSTVATCDADTTACATQGLVFSLAPKPSVQRSGTHTLVVIWKVESIGS